jgi:hypothetical protein
MKGRKLARNDDGRHTMKPRSMSVLGTGVRSEAVQAGPWPDAARRSHAANPVVQPSEQQGAARSSNKHRTCPESLSFLIISESVPPLTCQRGKRLSAPSVAHPAVIVAPPSPPCRAAMHLHTLSSDCSAISSNQV